MEERLRMGNGKERKTAEWIVFGLLVLAFAGVGFFHEPWYGEAEAWQIAKCAGIKELLFHIPHYEGHPPLWHLMLAVPAKLGLPYELSLKCIAGTAALLIGWVILFCSPFPKAVRLLLPFHYFFFYQYGIVARPYGYMVLFLFLAACCFRERDKKPWKFVFSLLFLCLFSAYGIVIAGGICIAWVLDICREKGWKLFSAKTWLDRRVAALAVLLLAAVLLILEMMPRQDTYAMAGGESNSVFLRLLYMLFMTLPESTALTVLKGEAFLKYASITPLTAAFAVLLGAILLFAAVCFSSGKNLKYYLIPYLLFACFSALVYFNAHHIGIAFALTVFWLWIAWEDDGRLALGKKILSRLKLSEKDVKTVRAAGKAAAAILFAVPLLWTLMSAWLDIKNPYFFGRDTARFIREKGLEELSVMAQWDITMPKDQESECDIYEYMDTNLINLPVSILPYLDRMTVWNMGMGDPSKAYVEHRIATPQENRETIQKWREHEIPEMVIGDADLEMLYGKEVASQYVPVYRIRPIYANIWKTGLSGANMMNCSFLYLRRDLLEKYGLEIIAKTPF